MPLERVLKCPLTPVLPSLGNADGTFAKTDKAKGMSHILKGTSSDTPDHEDTETLVTED